MKTPSQKSGGYSSEVLKQIKEKINLIEVIGEHVLLKKVGTQYAGLCPFHSERTPSFTVSESRQLYHCYGCKAGGDVITFVMELFGLDFQEAVQDLGRRAGIAVGPASPRSGAKQQEVEKKQELLFRLNRFASLFFRNHFEKAAPAQNYFQSRGFDPRSDLLRQYYVGYAPLEWHSLVQHLEKAKAPLEAAVELGLLKPNDRNSYYDIFRGRVLFPVLDSRGRIAGYGGRKIDALGVEGPKYLNSPDSLIFHKSQLLYGLYQAKKHIRELNEVVVVEGYFDLLALVKAGFENVVATCGTSLTVEHLKILSRWSEKIILLFDGDEAGLQAMENSMELGLKQQIILYGASLSGGLDPADLVHQGRAEELREVLKTAQPLLDRKIEQQIQKGLVDAQARVQTLHQIAQWLSILQDPIAKEIRAEQVCNRLRVSPETLGRAIGLHRGAPVRPSLPRPRHGAPVNLSKKGDAPDELIQPYEKTLLAALVCFDSYKNLWEKTVDNLPRQMTISDLFDTIQAKNYVVTLLQKNGLPDPVLVQKDHSLSEATSPQVRSVITEALVARELLYKEIEVAEALSKALARCWARFSQELKQRLVSQLTLQSHRSSHPRMNVADKQGEMSGSFGESQDRLMQEYLDVQKKIKEIKRFYEQNETKS